MTAISAAIFKDHIVDSMWQQTLYLSREYILRVNQLKQAQDLHKEKAV